MKLRNLVANPETKELLKDWTPIGGIIHRIYHFAKCDEKQRRSEYYLANAVYQSECIVASVFFFSYIL